MKISRSDVFGNVQHLVPYEAYAAISRPADTKWMRRDHAQLLRTKDAFSAECVRASGALQHSVTGEVHRPVLARDERSPDKIVDEMMEEDLLTAMQMLTPEEASTRSVGRLRGSGKLKER
jgi:hypothetical protein